MEKLRNTISCLMFPFSSFFFSPSSLLQTLASSPSQLKNLTSSPTSPSPRRRKPQSSPPTSPSPQSSPPAQETQTCNCEAHHQCLPLHEAHHRHRKPRSSCTSPPASPSDRRTLSPPPVLFSPLTTISAAVPRLHQHQQWVREWEDELQRRRHDKQGWSGRRERYESIDS
ncbi:hypothetical protein L1049_014643 [Liquidambar formosana]|uniref:Uncharacterized protein n=1 Tax=Liquidambar formosana TaxID=63359 RepID=A0AAP0X1Y5_LIQFO